MEKICFVVMGFGKKMDYRNSKEVDLDLIYKRVIKRLFEEELPEYRLIRADEISGSDMIDISMYTLLIKADLVIADITTSNENALYELGIRHALKPFSTIVMMQQSEKTVIPFDLNHNRILTYEDYGEHLDEDEAAEIRCALREFVKASETHRTDSPFYTYLPSVTPPSLEDEEYRKILGEATRKEETISAYMGQAEKLKKQSRFKEAVRCWGILHDMLPNNEYITQQLALATYKSAYPNKTMALESALGIIRPLKPETSLDLETLGITGAIYKRLFEENKNYAYLDEAIRMYQKGYIICRDYYTGENYATCLLLSMGREGLSVDEVTCLRVNSLRVYSELIDLLLTKIDEGETDYWMYATLATSCYAVGDAANQEKYETLFLENVQGEWEKDTYFENLRFVKRLLG